VSNSQTRYSIIIVLSTIALGAKLVGRDISWDTGWDGSIVVWDTPSANPTFDDSPCFSANNTAETVELLARAFARYL
jgi:hypothetical protein